MEVKAKEVEIGSITGGGRYDNLTGIFGLQGTSGVGISFGADRIYDVLQQLERFPEETASSTQILFINFGEEEVSLLQPLIRQMRKNNIAVELYPDNAKIKKQMTYADNLSIPYVVLAGSEEIKSGTYTLKNMLTGEQSLLLKKNFLPALSNFF